MKDKSSCCSTSNKCSLQRQKDSNNDMHMSTKSQHWQSNISIETPIRGEKKIDRIICLLPKPIGEPLPIPNSDSFVSVVKKLLKSSAQTIQPKFSFEVSKEATEKNLTLLLENNFDLHSLLNEHRGTSVTSYGSEFKSPHELEALFYRHPRWPQLKT